MATATTLKRNGNGTGIAGPRPAVNVTIDGTARSAPEGELLVELINRSDIKLAQVCYHPQLGPVQTCDTCMVEVDGRLVRACATPIADGMKISTLSSGAKAAREQ